MRRRGLVSAPADPLRPCALALALALLLAGPRARAFEPEAALPSWSAEVLTLERCVELALQDGPTQKMLRARNATAEAEEISVRTVPNPIFSYTAQDLGLVTPSGPALLHQQAVSFPILFFYTRQKAAQVARAARTQASALVDEERRQLQRTLGRSYLDAILLARLQRIDERAQQLAADLVAQASRRVQHGEAGTIEIARARAEALDAQRSAEQSQRRSDKARLQLSALLGAEQPFLVRLPEPAQPSRELLPRPAAGAPATDALALRPDLRAAQAALERARRQQELEVRRQVPLADLQLVAGARESAAGVGGLVALSVPVPLFDHNAGPLLAARAQAEAALAALVLSRRQAALELRRAEREWQGTYDALTRIARPLVPLREQALWAAQRQFAEGTVPLLEVITAQRDLLAAERALAEAEREAALAAWELRLALAAE